MSLRRPDKSVDAIECEWSVSAFDGRALKAFRALYPRGRNICVVPEAGAVGTKTVIGLEVTFASAQSLETLYAG